jgi:hypothetical protein
MPRRGDIITNGVMKIYCGPGYDPLSGVCEIKFHINEVFNKVKRN